LGWPAEGWHERIAPALVRGLCAIAFAGFSAFEVRFGSSALVIVSLSLAAFTGAIVYIATKMQSEFTVGVLAPDVVAVCILPSALWIASNIQVADAQLGGNTLHFCLAASAVVAICGVVAIVAAVINVTTPDRTSLAAAAGCFCAVAVLVGGTRFASGSLPVGLSLAWMAAGLLTLGDGIVTPRTRPMLRVAGITGYTVVVVALGVTGAERISNGTNSLIAYVAGVAIIGGLLRLPSWTASLQSWLVDDALPVRAPEATDGRFRS